MAHAFIDQAPWRSPRQFGKQRRRIGGVVSFAFGTLVLFASLSVSTGRVLGQGPPQANDNPANCSQTADGAAECELFGSGLVSFPTVDVRVELAETAADHARGLGGHAPLGMTDGMIFVFQTPGFYAFWMKGMTFNLDIMWIDGTADNLRVVHLASDVPAYPTETPDGRLPTYSPTRPGRYVLEVNAGFADKHGITVGSPASFIRDVDTQP